MASTCVWFQYANSAVPRASTGALCLTFLSFVCFESMGIVSLHDIYLRLVLCYRPPCRFWCMDCLYPWLRLVGVAAWSANLALSLSCSPSPPEYPEYCPEYCMSLSCSGWALHECGRYDGFDFTYVQSYICISCGIHVLVTHLTSSLPTTSSLQSIHNGRLLAASLHDYGPFWSC